MQRNSLRIYSFEESFELNISEISKRISKLSNHQYNLRKTEKDGNPRTMTLEFVKLNTTNQQFLCYTVTTTKTTIHEEEEINLHTIFFDKYGNMFLIGMQGREIFLKYLNQILFKGNSLYPRLFTKLEIDEFADKIINNTTNNIFRPRFHFSKPYKNRKFTDYFVSVVDCASGDSQFNDMKEKCIFWEPIFIIHDLFDEDLNCNLKLNRYGHFWLGHRWDEEKWISFIEKYLYWIKIK